MIFKVHLISLEAQILTSHPAYPVIGKLGKIGFAEPKIEIPKEEI